MLRWLFNHYHKISACTQLVLTKDDHLKFTKENWSCFTCFSNSYVIKDWKSKVCFSVDTSGKDTILCSIHLVTILLMACTVTRTTIIQLTIIMQKHQPPNETEATVHTQIVPHKKPHFFIIHAGPISTETNALVHYGSDTTLGKYIAKRLNVEGTLQYLTVTSTLSKSDKIDLAIAKVNTTSSTTKELPEVSV